jgi:hypothetical protein
MYDVPAKMVWTDNTQCSVGWQDYSPVQGLKCEENPRATHIHRKKGYRQGWLCEGDGMEGRKAGI